MVDNGDGPRPSSPSEVIHGWQATLSPLDAVYHQVNQYIITLTVRACVPGCVCICEPGSDLCGRGGGPRHTCTLSHMCLPGSVSLLLVHTHPCMCMERVRTRVILPSYPSQHKRDHSHVCDRARTWRGRWPTARRRTTRRARSWGERGRSWASTASSWSTPTRAYVGTTCDCYDIGPREGWGSGGCIFEVAPPTST